jgi:hypothetical protein
VFGNFQFKSEYIGWLIGAGSIAIALWIYHLSILKPCLSYSVDPNQASLVSDESNAITDFTIQYKGNTIFRKNVSAITVYLWNDGNVPTHRQQILSQIKVVLPPGSEILDATVLRETRSVCDVQIHHLESQNQIALDFNILEPGDGAALQIIYIGNYSASVMAEGIIEGQSGGCPIHS